eukprot:gene34047-37477_t
MSPAGRAPTALLSAATAAACAAVAAATGPPPPPGVTLVAQIASLSEGEEAMDVARVMVPNASARAAALASCGGATAFVAVVDTAQQLHPPRPIPRGSVLTQGGVAWAAQFGVDAVPGVSAARWEGSATNGWEDDELVDAGCITAYRIDTAPGVVVVAGWVWSSPVLRPGAGWTAWIDVASGRTTRGFIAGFHPESGGLMWTRPLPHPILDVRVGGSTLWWTVA